MAQVTSGKVLRETRERKGYDLTTVARRLRIRPDILRAIESGDFSAMPPRGYARNMIHAYARLLGLNPTEIVSMFLDEAYAHQVERARSEGPRVSFAMDRERRPHNRSEYTAAQGRRQDTIADYAVSHRTAEGGGRTSRRLYDDRTQFSHDGYGVARDRAQREGRSNRDFMSHHSGYPSASGNAGQNRRNRREGRQIHVGQTPMEVSAPRIPPWLMSRLPLIVIIIVVVLVLVLLLSFVFGGKGEESPEDVSSLPVSGISDTTGTEDAQEAEALNVEVAPTSARIVYSVGEGDEVYIETYQDNSTTPKAEILTGPAEQTVETTGVWTITTFTPDLVKLTVNGEETALQPSDEYGGMYAYTVDFPTMLEEWRKTHNSKSSQRQAAVASATNAASAASASSSSAAKDDASGQDASGGTSTGTTGGGATSGQGASGLTYEDVVGYGNTSGADVSGTGME